MGYSDVNRVVKYSRLRDTLRGTLFVLADMTNQKRGDGAAYISNEKLADRVGCIKRTIQNRMKVIAKTPELYVVPGGGRGNTPLYIITVGLSREDIAARLLLNEIVDSTPQALRLADEVLAREYPADATIDRLPAPDKSMHDYTRKGANDGTAQQKGANDDRKGANDDMQKGANDDGEATRKGANDDDASAERVQTTTERVLSFAPVPSHNNREGNNRLKNDGNRDTPQPRETESGNPAALVDLSELDDDDDRADSSLSLEFDLFMSKYAEVCGLDPTIKAHREQYEHYALELWRARYTLDDLDYFSRWIHTAGIYENTSVIYPSQVHKHIARSRRDSLRDIFGDFYPDAEHRRRYQYDARGEPHVERPPAVFSNASNDNPLSYSQHTTERVDNEQ